MDIHIVWRELLFFPLDPTLLIGPALYFYLVALTNETFEWERKHLLHWIPFGIYAIYHLIIFVQGVNVVQSWMATVDLPYVQPVYTALCVGSNFLYLFWTFQHFRQYRVWVETEYSNPEEMEFGWYNRYLLVLTLGISLSWLFQGLNAWGFTIFFTQNWWEYFFFAILLYAISIPGFHQTEVAHLNFEPRERPDELETDPSLEAADLRKGKQQLDTAMREGAYFLNPKLSLAELSREIGMPSAQLSQIINAGFDKNFNQFVNTYRVEAFQQMVMDPKQAHLSFLAIALDCGFNSKATFNRVFKQMTGLSPREYVQQQRSSPTSAGELSSLSAI
ncbi:MAG: helix-turn-helix domain-containing protein [Bacteroidota bacterium]